MAGRFFDKGKEYNVFVDAPASQKVFNDWPTPLYASPWELGDSLKYPAVSIERDYGWAPHHPVADAYRLYMKFPYDRPTWDLTSVLFAVRPDRGYFTVNEPGKITSDAIGKTTFAPDPQGRHYVLSATPEQKTRTLEALIALSSQPTDRIPKGETK